MTEIPAHAVDRIHGGADLDSLIERAARAYGVGRVSQLSVIEMGYEDCNVDVITDRGRYVFKVFATVRTPATVDRYVHIIEEVCRAGVSHPRVHLNSGGHTLFVDQSTDNRLVVMDYVDGRSYMELKRTPSTDELGFILEQATRINALNLRPPFLFDSWAIPNIDKMVERVALFLDASDRRLVDQALRSVHDVDVEALPHAFVHGDIIKTNVVVSSNRTPFILDFAVANVYPRIQELAVIAANLLHDGVTSLRERVDLVATAYGSLNPLTSDERRALDGYALGAVAMEFLGSLKEMHLNGNHGDETRYWLDLGRSGLRSATQELGLT